MKKRVYSILGTTLDVVSKRKGKYERRWEKWRPTISIGQRPDDLLIDELVILCSENDLSLAEDIQTDFQDISPSSDVRIETLGFESPWDLETSYIELKDFIDGEKLSSRDDNYFHITTGSHIQQIVVFLLTESRIFPGKLLQTAPPSSSETAPKHQIIDLDLSKYDELARRFNDETLQATEFLKAGIQTKNASFNAMINQIERVALKSREALLITGPTGAGKSKLAERIFQLKKQRNIIQGEFVQANCATLIGENSMSTLFGHKKGAFTGALDRRNGLLKRADKGVLFLDEIGELGLDEQAMLLQAIESKTFLALGSDTEDYSDFQLIAGTNKDLKHEVAKGLFRADLLARINLWTYQLPGLAERREDIEANLSFELGKYQAQYGEHVSFTRDAKTHYLSFALDPSTLWSANFRDLNASITRMATLSEAGRIQKEHVDEEIERLKESWSAEATQEGNSLDLQSILNSEVYQELDYIEKIELEAVLRVCIDSKDGAEAGRKLYNKSRLRKKTRNDSHRLKVYLDKYNLSFSDITKL